MSPFDYADVRSYYDHDYWNTPGVKSGYTNMSRSIGGDWHTQACGWLNSAIAVQGKTLLDAGCGLGHFMKAFDALGARVVGVDPSDYCVNFITANVHLPVIQTTLEDMRQIGDNAFDLVYCGATLEHIPEEHLDLALRNLCRVTVPGGLLFLEIDTKPDELRDTPEESHVNIKPWSMWLWDLSHPSHPWFIRDDLVDALHACRDFPGFPLADWSFIVLEKKRP